MFFCFFCELLLHFLSTSVMFDSNSLVFLLPVCFTQLPFCIYLLSLFLKKIQFPSCFFHLRYLLRAFTPPLSPPQFQFSGIFLHCSAFDFSGHPRGTTGGFLKKLHEWCDKYVKSIYKCISFGFTELQFKCKGSYLCSTICQHIFNSPAWLLLFLLNVFLNWIFIEKLVFVASLKCHVLGVPT